MPADRCVRHSFPPWVDPQHEKRARRCRVRTGVLFYLRQGRSGATGKERRENSARGADEEPSISRRAKLLCRAGIACAANGGIAPVEPGKISRTEGVPAL